MAKKNPPAKKAPKRDPEETEDQDQDQEGNEDDTDDEDSAEAENRRINAIVTSRVKREMKGVMSQLATINEALGKLAAPKKTDDEDSDEDGQDGQEGEDAKKQAQPDPKLSRKMTKLEKELAEEKAARKKAEQDRAEEQDRARKKEMHSAFESALTDLGCTDPVLRRAAIRELEDSGKMVRDDNGKIKFRGEDRHGFETDFNPVDGLKTWITKEGKSFVPAIDAGGSGTGGTNRGVGNSNLTSKEFSKLTDQQKASINLERACSGLPPLE